MEFDRSRDVFSSGFRGTRVDESVLPSGAQTLVVPTGYRLIPDFHAARALCELFWA